MALNNFKKLSSLSIKNNTMSGIMSNDDISKPKSATQLLSEAFYYIDADNPIDWPSLGYVDLPGQNGEYMFTDDSPELDITGDIDIRVKLSKDDWTVGGVLVSKRITGQVSYSFHIAAAGVLYMLWSPNNSTLLQHASSDAVPFSAGQTGWVRATLDVNNGSGGYTLTFLTSTNGTTWTTLDTIVVAGTTSIYSGSAPLEIGTRSNGSSEPINARIYQAQIFNGINGTKVFDMDIPTDYKTTDFDAFTCSTGQRVNVVGLISQIANRGTAGTALETMTGSNLGINTNQPKFLDHTGTNYIYLPGLNGNYMSVPDANNLDITGDIDLRVYCALSDWTPPNIDTLISKQDTGQESYGLQVNTDGTLSFIYTTDGSTLVTRTSTASTNLWNDYPKWIRVTFDVNNGSGGNDVAFYMSDDNSTWTQIGTTVTNSGTVSMFSGTAQVEIGGSVGGADSAAGKFYRAQIYDGIGGTLVLDVDTSVITTGSQTSFTALTGQTVSIFRPTTVAALKTSCVTQPLWLFGTDDYLEITPKHFDAPPNFLYLPGFSGNFASVPDNAALDINGDIDIRIKVALDQFNGGILISKRTGNSSGIAWALQVNSNGTLRFIASNNGTSAQINANSTVAVSDLVLDGLVRHLRVTLDADNGASGNDVTFYTSDDGTTWTQLGNIVTTAGTMTIFNSNAPVLVGAARGGIDISRGKYYRAQIYDGINGTLVLDANFESSLTSFSQTTFTESSANAFTVTINKSGTRFQASPIVDTGYLYQGATNTFVAGATDYFSVPESQSLTVLAVTRIWNNFGNFDTIFSNARLITTTEGYGWTLGNSNPGTLVRFRFGDGTNGVIVNSTENRSNGILAVTAGIKNVELDTITSFLNENGGTPSTDPTTGTVSFVGEPRIGRLGLSGAEYSGIELISAAVWDRRLLDVEINVIKEYFFARGT